jgi:2-polyprenyl-3-methyl-5-hydroxy-6-metoxy-1,4-benzoquinol methylase
MIKTLLGHPLVYQQFQTAAGFFRARLKAIAAYLPMQGGEKIVDIGCGPGFMAKHLPSKVSYLGFDIDDTYISYARTHFGDKGRFFCQLFDAEAARQHGPVDIVMMNGVLHHLTDDEVHDILRVVSSGLSPRGRLFTLDGCFSDDQSSVARFLLKSDRGQYVRTRKEYESLMTSHFNTVEVHIENAWARVPYTFIIMVGR